MPLQKAHITIPLSGGLATALDDKLLPIGKSIEMENCRQGRLGEIVPRIGTAALSLNILGNASTIPAPWAMASYKGALVSLSQIGDYPLAMWSPTAGQWVSGGQSSTSSLSGQTDIRTARRGPVFARGDRLASEGTAPDIAYSSGYYFTIYQYIPPGGGVSTIYQRITDSTTGRTVADRIVQPGAVGYLTGVRCVNGFAVFCYSDGATTGFVFDVWQISNLDAGPTTYTAPALGLGIAIRTAFDMLVKDATTISVAYYHVGTNAIRGIDIIASSGATTVWILNDATAATVPLGSWNWVKDIGGSGKIALATYSVAQGVRVQWNIPTAGATRQAANTYAIDAAPGTVSNIAAATFSAAAGGEIVLLYDVVNISTPTSTIKAGYFQAGAIGESTHRGITLRSKIWKQGSDFYAVCEMPSPTQNTRFVTRIDLGQLAAGQFPYLFPVAKAQLNNGVLLSTSSGAVSDVVNPSSGNWVSANTVTVRLSGQPSAYGTTYSGIEFLTTSYHAAPDATTGTPREAIDSLFVPGGTLGAFDGVTYGSADFAAYPERLALSAGGGGSGALSAGTYYYKSTYARTDVSGRVWRSAPSTVQSQAVVATGSSTVVVPTLRVIDTLSFADGYSIELWRGDVNDNNTYKLVGVKPNNIAADSVTFTDTLADTAIDGNEFLYTNGGGVLPNDAHPGFTSICVAGNRLWGAYKNELWMSNLFIPGRGLLWAEQNKIILNDQHGDITAIGAQPNGVVVVFKADAVYGVAGDGPDQAGRGGFQVQFVAISMGTLNARSIVETSVGTEFLSTGTRHGWYRIGLGLSPEYIGGAVEKYAGTVVVGSILLPNSNETRYYLATGGSLVHDYVTDLWGIDTGQAATCAAAWGSLGVYATAAPAVIVDSNAIPGFDVGFVSIVMKVTTPWIKLSELKGYERFYRVMGVGELGDDSKFGTTTVAMQTNLDPNTTIATLGAHVGHLWDWELRYSAKVDSVRFIITDIIGNEATPNGIKWSAIVLEYGQHANVRQRPSGNRVV
jgi:hypothetical protein